MDFSNPRRRSAFFEIHRDLPREGPGDRASTLRALAMAGDLPRAARVLDIACGPGAQTLDLASALPDARIIALDNHRPYLAALRRQVDDGGPGERIETVVGDMAAMVFPARSFDLIWCEGAAYILGVPRALELWRPLLRTGGRIALTEAVWLRPDPPDEARTNWLDYPAMTDVAGVRGQFAGAGYELLGDFVLPSAAWWNYYGPMEERVADLRNRLAADPDALAVWREARDEIDAYRRHGDSFGYAFFVAALRVDTAPHPP